MAFFIYPLIIVSLSYLASIFLYDSPPQGELVNGVRLDESTLRRCRHAGESCTQWCLQREGVPPASLGAAAAACEHFTGSSAWSFFAVLFALSLGIAELGLHMWAARHLFLEWRDGEARDGGPCCACTGATSGKSAAAVAAMAPQRAAMAPGHGSLTPRLSGGATSLDEDARPSEFACACCPLRSSGDALCCCEAAFGQLELATRSLEEQRDREAAGRVTAQREARQLAQALEQESAKLQALQRQAASRTDHTSQLAHEATVKLREENESLRSELDSVRRSCALQVHAKDEELRLKDEEMRQVEERALASLRQAETLAGATERCVFSRAGETLPSLAAGAARMEAAGRSEELACSVQRYTSESWSARAGS